jgi:hypothetical protein
MIADKNQEALMRLFLGLLLFRLGGEQTFTPAEIDDIRDTVQGVTWFTTDEGRIGIRTRGPAITQRAIDNGSAI